MSLPFGAVAAKPETGHADGAPLKPNLWIKFIITSVITLIITYIIIYLIENGYMKAFAMKYLELINF